MSPLKILIVASEAVPYAKTGGLADVAGILPKFLAKRGHDVRVVMPRYYGVDKIKYDLKPVGGPLGVPMGVVGEQWCGVLEGRLPNSNVPVYFIDHEEYFGRDAIYNDESGQGFLDNDNRFVFLSRASMQLCKMLGFSPDIIHANDWQTAAVPLFLNTHYKNDPIFSHTASILTIHNMQYQGQFYEGVMDVLAVGWEHFTFVELEHHDQVNLLKGGIYNATLVNTVSDGYKNEIKTKEYGWELEGAILSRGDAVRGILNGIDYDEWNPATDKYLPANYDEHDLSGKAICKAKLQEQFGLPQNDVPILGMVSRLVEQKGIDLVMQAIHHIMALDVQMIVLGEGDPIAHEFLKHTASQYPHKFACKIGYDNSLAHRIEAGADFFIMPSRFEPCGLNQMYSLRYGTPPIVRATGGLDDTIENLDEKTGHGTGFKFIDADGWALFNTVGWAVWIYYNRKEMLHGMRVEGMKKRFRWEDSAEGYEALYLEAVKIKNA